MDRKIFIRDVYAKYWERARELRYGFSSYDRHLCEWTTTHLSQGATLLDVGVGTGYPFAGFLVKAGYQIHGLDISPRLIAKCREAYPDVTSKVGDAECIDYPSSYFDCTYSFHSTWYFPNLLKAIDEMLRVTKSGGFLLFDIQNRNNQKIGRHYEDTLKAKSGIGMLKRQLKNLARLALFSSPPTWKYLIYETPTCPQTIYQYCKDRSIENYTILGSTEDGSLKEEPEKGPLPQYARLVFAIQK